MRSLYDDAAYARLLRLIARSEARLNHAEALTAMAEETLRRAERQRTEPYVLRRLVEQQARQAAPPAPLKGHMEPPHG